MILIGKLSELSGHSRFIVSLRSTRLESKYHSIVVYAVDQVCPMPAEAEQEDHPEKELAGRLGSAAPATSQTREWHAMEEECPHLGASMAEADLEIEDDGVIAICPWHKLGLVFTSNKKIKSDHVHPDAYKTPQWLKSRFGPKFDNVHCD